jgi:hypothetical protein
LFTTLVLICSLAITPDLRECNRNNAVHVVQVPEQYAVPGSCFMHGQAYVAGTDRPAIGRKRERQSALHQGHQSDQERRLSRSPLDCMAAPLASERARPPRRAAARLRGLDPRLAIAARVH